MPLQEFLHGLAVHLCLGREIIAAEEESEHSKTPLAQTGEMLIGIVNGKGRPTNETLR
jgi:hypothetical protein